MGFIDKSVSFSIVLLINCMSVRSENCQPLIDLITNNKLYILNASEIVAFFPIDFKFITTNYGGVTCSSGNCSTTNEVKYKNERIESLSNTDLAISNEDLSLAIYHSLSTDTQLNDIISVFPNRFVMKSRTEKNTFLVYSTVFGINIDIPNPGCDKSKFQYRSKIAKIRGIVCNIVFQSGIRYSLGCGDITLYLNAVDEDTNLDHDTKCDP
ncbi:uncharacterized protein LOC113557501 [Rhopalosiphum maidis]|uniref:uncharacterized protein LOC113557501 n=1 Tax=Rhopalosiphum maidis TaxID=43146 RepID=UPI000EFE3795|nr:uncharacterized protein LOC113557501 [Rhopalosiphum maidis]